MKVSPQAIDEHLVRPIAEIFPPSRAADFEAVIGTTVEILSHDAATIADLKAARIRLAGSHKFARFPVPAEFRAAIQQAQAAAGTAPQQPRHTPEKGKMIRSLDAAQSRANGSIYAHRAATDGWIVMLDDWFLYHDDEPAENDARRMKTSSERFYQECMGSFEKSGALRLQLEQLRDAIVRRRQQRTAEILGDTA